MITRFKIFENDNNDIHVGDYVYCYEGDSVYSNDDKKFIKFLSKEIGKCVAISDDESFLIQYENIPSKIEKYFAFGEQIYWSYVDKKDAINCREMTIDEILYHGSSKEDVEMQLNVKKYNL